jgi:hypothetical protein
MYTATHAACLTSAVQPGHLLSTPGALHSYRTASQMQRPTQAECQGDATNGAVSERALDNNTTCTYIVKMRACMVLDKV